MTLARAAAVVLLCGAIVLGLRAALPAGELRDFGSFVASGRAASEGLDPYGIYPLTFHVVLPGFDVWNPNLNPPASLPAFQVLALTDPHAAFRGFWFASLGCYVLAVLLLVRRYGAGPWALTAVWALALAGFWDTLALGQIYLPLVLAACVAWLLLENRHMTAAGLLIGCVVAIKPNFALWPALLLLSGHRRSALTAIAIAGAAWLAPIALYGGGIYRQWLGAVVSDADRAAFLTNASVPGFAQRLHVGPMGWALSILLIGTLAWWAMRRPRHVLDASAWGLLGGIAASPIAWVHYTLFLLPVFFARGVSALSLAAAALLVVPVPLVLRALDAPLWQQATMGSVYSWAVLFCLVGFNRDLSFGARGHDATDGMRISAARMRVLTDTR